MFRPSSRRIQERLAEYLKSGLSPKTLKKISALPDVMEAGRFLYNAGYYRALLELSLNNLRKKKPAPWPFVMKTLTDHNINLPEEAVKPLLKIFLSRFEKNRLWFSACGEWAKISPEFQALIQSGSKEGVKRSPSKAPEQAPENTKPALKPPAEHTGGLSLSFDNEASQGGMTAEDFVFSSQTDPGRPGGRSALSPLESGIQKRRLSGADPAEEKTALLDSGSPDQQPSLAKNSKELSSNSAVESFSSLSFSDGTNPTAGDEGLGEPSKQRESGLFSSGPRQINEEDDADLEERQLFRQLEFVRAKGLLGEEEEIIQTLMSKNPKRYKDLDKELKMKKALEFLQSQKLSGGGGRPARRLPPQTVSEKESPCEARICKAAGLSAEKRPETAKDLAVFLYMLGRPSAALKTLEGNLKNISEYWLYLSWLLEVGKHAVALDITHRLLVKLRSDSESLFPITYIKAQALYALGEKEQAVSYMSDIVKVRPTYKSARHFLEEWTKI